MILTSMLHPLASILAYTPFVTPLPIWNWWYVLLIPLSAAVAVVYKAIKIHSMREVPRHALVITLWIIFGMIAAAVVLGALVRILEM
jgi:hypothetical protein